MRHFILTILLLSRLSFQSSGQAPVDVAENTFKVAGLGEEIFYYGFAEGDQLIFNFEEVNGKDLKEIEIIELPFSSKFMDYKTDKIEDKKITITNTGIYKFRFANSALSSRVCKLKIQRIPSGEATKNFKTEVYWKTIYDTTYTIVQEKYLINKEYVVEQLTKEKHYINSGSNAMFKGGESRISIPVNLPRNTVEWYYTFSASRNAQEIERTYQTINIAGQLTKLIDRSGVLKIGIDMIAAPSGGDDCDIYLLDNDNRAPFEAKTQFSKYLEGSRDNMRSGTVQIRSTKFPNMFLGIKNPDVTYGINFAIEVDAITLNEQWGVRDVKKNNISSRNEAYLKN